MIVNNDVKESNIIKPDLTKKGLNKIEFSLNFENVLKNKINPKLVYFDSSQEDSNDENPSDDEETLRINEKSLDDEEFKKIIESSHKNEKTNSDKNNENSEKNKNTDKNEIRDSNYNLLRNSSSDKSKKTLHVENDEIILKPNLGSTSSRKKDEKNNKDYILDFGNYNASKK